MNKDFELFDKICKAIQAQDKKDEAFTEATKYVDLFENGFIYDTSSLVDCLVDIAESLFPDSKSHWASWWIYENDFGKNGFSVSDQDGEKVIKTNEEFWNWINKDQSL